MESFIKKHYLINRKLVGVFIVLFVSLIHWLRLGQYLSGDLRIIYQSYVSDILVPLSFYYLVCIVDLKIRILQKWHNKAIFVFCTATFFELLQLFGIKILGTTFDIPDILMYAIGVAIAVIIDLFLLKRFVPNWEIGKE